MARGWWPWTSPGFPAVRTVPAEHVSSHDRFLALLDSSDEPLLLRSPPLARQEAAAAGFTVRALAEQLPDLCLPSKSLVAKQGVRSSSGCSIFIAEQERGEPVMGAAPRAWDPGTSTFGAFLEGIAGGSGRYLTTRSGKGACRRTGDVLAYEAPGGCAGADADGYDVLVRALVPRVPAPLLLPEDRGFQAVFWVGAKGNNFGLHTDLFAEQFLAQHEGVKEVLLLLPEDAAVVAPFPFLGSPLWYKSERRSVSNLHLRGERCLRAELHPGDVLYIPLWWWHEVRTLSEGPSLSTTFRFHTEDADRFSRVMNAFFQFHKSAQERPCGRLARHLRSYFVYSLARAEEEAEHRDQVQRRRWSWRAPFGGWAPPGALFLAGLAAASAIGFVAGHRFSSRQAAS